MKNRSLCSKSTGKCLGLCFFFNYVNMIYLLSLATTHTRNERPIDFCSNSIFREFFSSRELSFVPLPQFYAPRTQNQNWKIEGKFFPAKCIAAPEERSGIFLVCLHMQTVLFPSNVFRKQRLRATSDRHCSAFRIAVEHGAEAHHVSFPRRHQHCSENKHVCVHKCCSSRSILIEQCSSLWDTTKSSQKRSCVDFWRSYYVVVRVGDGESLKVT